MRHCLNDIPQIFNSEGAEGAPPLQSVEAARGNGFGPAAHFACLALHRAPDSRTLEPLGDRASLKDDHFSILWSSVIIFDPAPGEHFKS